jgi:two-component system nitrate/nitrite response regulator NarL
MSAPVRVVVADDHPLLRAGVAQILQQSGKFEVVGQGGSADEAIRLVTDLVPDLVLLDLSMPGSGLNAARHIGDAFPDVKVVVLTVSEAHDDIIAALKAGAKGYVLKGVGASTLVEIVEGVTRGESYVSPALAARLLTEMRIGERSGAPRHPLADLTEREEQILRLVATGLSNKAIGLKLDLQEKTVKHHMTRILNKLNVRNRTEAAILLRDTAPPSR